MIQKKILIIDDDPAIRKVLAEFSKMSGYAVFEASNSAEGHYKISVHHPDLVILDLHMPGIHGKDLLKQIRIEHPELPVIILTGDKDPELKKQLKAVPFVTYVEKPFDPDTFFEKIIISVLFKDKEG